MIAVDPQEAIVTHTSIRIVDTEELVDTQPSIRMESIKPNTDQLGPEVDPPMPSVLGDQKDPLIVSPLSEKGDFLENGHKGRLRTFYETIDLLQSVREAKGEWPGGTLVRLQYYYKHNYPEYFRNGKRAEQTRLERERKAERIRAENKPRTKKVRQDT